MCFDSKSITLNEVVDVFAGTFPLLLARCYRCCWHVYIIFVQGNSRVETLDVEENGLEGEGAVYIADMLRENSFITAVVSIYFH